MDGEISQLKTSGELRVLHSHLSAVATATSSTRRSLGHSIAGGNVARHVGESGNSPLLIFAADYSADAATALRKNGYPTELSSRFGRLLTDPKSRAESLTTHQ